MFTQEQLDSIRFVVVESLKPMEERVNNRFDSLEKKVDEGFEKMDEGFEKMDQKMDFIDKKMDKGFAYFSEQITDLQEDTKDVCDIIDELKTDNFVIKAKLAAAERNRPGLFV